jgi:hypothetical protein
MEDEAPPLCRPEQLVQRGIGLGREGLGEILGIEVDRIRLGLTRGGCDDVEQVDLRSKLLSEVEGEWPGVGGVLGEVGRE